MFSFLFLLFLIEIYLVEARVVFTGVLFVSFCVKFKSIGACFLCPPAFCIICWSFVSLCLSLIPWHNFLNLFHLCLSSPQLCLIPCLSQSVSLCVYIAPISLFPLCECLLQLFLPLSILTFDCVLFPPDHHCEDIIENKSVTFHFGLQGHETHDCNLLIYVNWLISWWAWRHKLIWVWCEIQHLSIWLMVSSLISI